jgi:hypothetical protein
MTLKEIHEDCIDSGRRLYSPSHLAVFKNMSTKTRAVFNGSAKTGRSGLSLNNTLMVECVIQVDLYYIILWFWLQPVFIVEAEQMYRQVNIHPDETSLKRSPCRT